MDVGIGGKATWHDPKRLESPVANATVGMIQNVNCASICRRLIAGLSQSKVLPSPGKQNLIGSKINPRSQRKTRQNILYG